MWVCVVGVYTSKTIIDNLWETLQYKCIPKINNQQCSNCLYHRSFLFGRVLNYSLYISGPSKYSSAYFQIFTAILHWLRKR